MDMRVLPPVLLLDLDDTLVDDASEAAECWEMVCVQYAPQAGVPAERLQAAIKTYSGWYWSDPERHRRGRLELGQARRAVVAGAWAQLGLDRPELAQAMADAYSVLRATRLTLLPGALDTLQTLRQRGCRLGLITNGASAPQRSKIERFELAPFFELILIEGEFGAGKPDERVYRHALEVLAAAPAEAWMVGDNLEWDVAGAQRAGLCGIWVDGAGRGLPADSPTQPDRIIRGVGELV